MTATVSMVRTDPSSVFDDVHQRMNLAGPLRVFGRGLTLLVTCLKEAPELSARRRRAKRGT